MIMVKKMVIIKSLSNKDYHAMEGLSKSKMDKLEISPAHYKASLETFVKVLYELGYKLNVQRRVKDDID